MKQGRTHGLFDRLIDTFQAPARDLRRVSYVEFEYDAPEHGTTGHHRADDWTVTSVQLTVEHPGILANGRQQSRIYINIEAKLNGVPVRLTEVERASIRIIRYDDAQEFPIDDGDSNECWSSQKAYRGYRFPSSRDNDDEADDVHAGEIFEFYVSAGIGEAGNLRRLGFSLHGDNGWIYRTTGWCTAPDGREQYFAHMDIKAGNAVEALPPPTYQAAQLELNGQRALMPIDNQAVTLAIFDAGRPVGIRRMTCTPEGVIHWYRNTGASPCFTGYAEPGDTTYRWNPDVPKGQQPLPSTTTVREPTIIVCARNDIPRGSHQDPPQGALLVELIDDFGTTLQRRISFDPDTRERLMIS